MRPIAVFKRRAPERDLQVASTHEYKRGLEIFDGLPTIVQ